MKKNEQEIERITRSLMKETVEQPSSDLNSRIMGLLLKKAPQRKVSGIGKTISPALLSGVFIVYMLIVAGSLLVLQNKAGEISELTFFLKDAFPVFLTIGGGVSFFILFAQLDDWLKQREHNNTPEK